MDAIYNVVSGAMAQEKRLEVIVNNLANINTNGFKKDFPVFEGMVMAGGGPVQDSFVTAGVFTKIVTDLSPGSIRRTENPLDIAIDGDGFFVVESDDGTRYTRNGSFRLDSEGQLITAGGYPVLGTGGPIILPPGDVSISENGRVSLKGVESGAQPIEVDTLLIVQFSSPEDIRKTGESLFEAIGNSPVPTTESRLHQGSLEGSNVDLVVEMVSMIRVMRLYESAQKAIQTADDIAAKAANDIGGLT